MSSSLDGFIYLTTSISSSFQSPPSSYNLSLPLASRSTSTPSKTSSGTTNTASFDGPDRTVQSTPPSRRREGWPQRLGRRCLLPSYFTFFRAGFLRRPDDSGSGGCAAEPSVCSPVSPLPVPSHETNDPLSQGRAAGAYCIGPTRQVNAPAPGNDSRTTKIVH